MPVPTPEQLNRDLADIHDDLHKIRALYAVAHPNAFQQPKHGSQEIVAGGDEHDLADIVASTERFRSYLEDVAKIVRHQRKECGRAVGLLNDALRRLDPPPGIEVAEIGRLPHSASHLDRLRAKAAQIGRKGRGDESELVILDKDARRASGVR